MLLAVGRDDGIGSNLRQQADTLNLGKKVRFLGPREDVADLLRISDLGILCSHEEGFSNAILEGMAASLPMVVTDVGGNAEAVKNGTTGLVVAAHSPSELGTAILRLVKDAALRKRMGQAARNHVEQEFSLEACVEQYEKLYDAVGSNQKLHLEG
jgi:glycosyltransferase involved in cell wall biosynthesis